MRVFTQKDIGKKLLPIFKAYPIRRAVLFGSYAKGNATAKSDIDILIDSNGAIRGIDFFGVLEDMTNALGAEIDLLEMSQIIKGSRVQKEIDANGVVIYESA
jgi:predicted nucleotidyltransferase